MKQNNVGIVISVIILFLGLVMLPTYYIGIIQWRTDMDIAIQASRDFLDKAIDSGNITKDMESDLNLSLSACSATFSYNVTREVPVVDEIFTGGVSKSEAATTWQQVKIEESSTFNAGDILTITVRQEGMNLFQRLAAAFVGTPYAGKDIIFSAMVK